MIYFVQQVKSFLHVFFLSKQMATRQIHIYRILKDYKQLKVFLLSMNEK